MAQVSDNTAYILITVVTYHEDARNTGSVKRIYDEDHLQKEATRLERYIIGIETTSALLQEPPTLSLSYTMFYELQKWVKSRVSKMLWIAGPTDSNFRYPSTMSNAAASMVQLFTLTGLVVIYHFCELPEISAPINNLSREELGLISLVCSLIRQLIIAAGPQFESSLDFSRERFAQLNSSMEGFKEALQLLKDLVDLCPAYIVCIIDGIDNIDYDKGREGCRTLLKALRELMALEVNDAGEGRVFKVLFTTASRPGMLMRDLKDDEMLLEDEGGDSLELAQVSPGRTAIARLTEDIS